MVKNQRADAGGTGGVGLIPARKISWRRKWQPTLVFLLGKFHGQRSLVDYSPWGHKECPLSEIWTFSIQIKFHGMTIAQSNQTCLVTPQR